MAVQIVDLLFNLVYSNVYAKSEDILVKALKNRFIGFRAEIELSELFEKHGEQIFQGGYILPLRDGKATLDCPLYFTIDTKPTEYYKELYSRLDKGSFSKLYYISYNSEISFDNWETIKFDGQTEMYKVPELTVYDFQNNKFVKLGSKTDILLNLLTPKQNPYIQSIIIKDETVRIIKSYLEQYNKEQLLNLYVSRLIFDGFVGLKYHKGLPSDIDIIIKDTKSEYKLIEVKEKDLSKTPPIGFGIDVQRLNDCLNLSEDLGLRYLYIVRQVNNQKDRKFISWRSIAFKNFNKLTDKSIVKNGGTGMNTAGHPDNLTVLVEDKYFKPFC